MQVSAGPFRRPCLVTQGPRFSSQCTKAHCVEAYLETWHRVALPGISRLQVLIFESETKPKALPGWHCTVYKEGQENNNGITYIKRDLYTPPEHNWCSIPKHFGGAPRGSFHHINICFVPGTLQLHEWFSSRGIGFGAYGMNATQI